MNLLIQNRRKPIFETQQDGKKLTLGQIQTFYTNDDIFEIIESLKDKGYLKEKNERYNPVTSGYRLFFNIFFFGK